MRKKHKITCTNTIFFVYRPGYNFFFNYIKYYINIRNHHDGKFSATDKQFISIDYYPSFQNRIEYSEQLSFFATQQSKLN